jgi:hypothetical protein
MDSPDHRSSTGDAGPKAQFAHSEITTASDDLASQGAVILESERDLSAFQLAKRHWRVILTSKFHPLSSEFTIEHDRTHFNAGERTSDKETDS